VNSSQLDIPTHLEIQNSSYKSLFWKQNNIQINIYEYHHTLRVSSLGNPTQHGCETGSSHAALRLKHTVEALVPSTVVGSLGGQQEISTHPIIVMTFAQGKRRSGRAFQEFTLAWFKWYDVGRLPE